jgi:hypothetical protein
MTHFVCSRFNHELLISRAHLCHIEQTWIYTTSLQIANIFFLPGLDSTSHAPVKTKKKNIYHTADNSRLLDPISIHGIGIYQSEDPKKANIPPAKDFFIDLCTRPP